MHRLYLEVDLNANYLATKVEPEAGFVPAAAALLLFVRCPFMELSTPTAICPIAVLAALLNSGSGRQKWQTLHTTLPLWGRWSTNASSCRVGFDALGYCPRRRRTSFSSSLMRAAACWARESWSS